MFALGNSPVDGADGVSAGVIGLYSNGWLGSYDKGFL